MIKSKYKILKIFDDKEIYLAIFDNQYELTSTMIRMQEFYESDNLKFRNKLFTLDDYMDYYAQTHNTKFSYFEDWNGFNIPSNVINKWVSGIDKSDKHEFRDKELNFLNTLFDTLETNIDNKWYLIAVHSNDNLDTLKHEIAHALYYLDPSYKKNAITLINTIPTYYKNIMLEYLTNLGYGKNVLFDEMNAYMSTSGKRLYKSILDHIKSHKIIIQEEVNELYKYQAPFIKLFKMKLKLYKNIFKKRK
jgi:hypothetical protein